MSQIPWNRQQRENHTPNVCFIIFLIFYMEVSRLVIWHVLRKYFCHLTAVAPQMAMSVRSLNEISQLLNGLPRG